MSREEFERLPEGPPFYDYVNGEAVEVNRATGKHQRIVFRLANLLWEHVQGRQLGDVFPDIDVALPTGNVYGPDIVFVAAEHMHRYSEASGDLLGAPDLAVEVLSATTEAYDRGQKLQDFYASEVPWVWLVNQTDLGIAELQRTAEGYAEITFTPAGEAFTPRLFPDLRIDLEKLIGGS
jgi:Uma2 family endonuclease